MGCSGVGGFASSMVRMGLTFHYRSGYVHPPWSGGHPGYILIIVNYRKAKGKLNNMTHLKSLLT